LIGALWSSPLQLSQHLPDPSLRTDMDVSSVSIFLTVSGESLSDQVITTLLGVAVIEQRLTI
jgi:hypothetical protein